MGVVCALLACLAAAQPTVPPESPPAAAPATPTLLSDALSDGRLHVGFALSAREGTLRDEGLSSRFGGLSPSHLRLSGAAFLRALPLGLSADVAQEWYAATGPNLVGVEETHRLAGTRGSLALAGRLRPLPALALEGHVGYGFGALPFLDASWGHVKALSLQHHGPLLAAAVLYEPGGPLLAQLTARLMPVALGAGSLLGEGRLVHGALGAQLGAGGWRLGGARWHAVLDYALEVSAGTTGDAELAQTAHRLGVGLRASFGEEALGSPARKRTGAPVEVRGRVTYGDSGEPAAGVQVAVSGGPTVTTDAQGAFTVPVAGPGPVVLTVHAAGYRDATQAVEPRAQGEAALALVLARATGPGHVRGTVRLGVPGGTPVPAEGLLVESPGVAPARTGPDGAFTLGPVGPGPVPVTVRAPGRRAAEEVVAVPAGGEAALDVVLEKAGPGTPATLRAEVRSAAGRPVVGATMRVAEARARARADRQGRLQLRLPAGRYSVVFAARGYVTQTRVVEVAEGDQAIFHIRLVPLEP